MFSCLVERARVPTFLAAAILLMFVIRDVGLQSWQALLLVLVLAVTAL
jgi:hypothetical protein